MQEFPNWENTGRREVGDFTTLMRELRAATSANGMLLTAALRASPTPGDHADIRAISGLVDWVRGLACNCTLDCPCAPVCPPACPSARLPAHLPA